MPLSSDQLDALLDADEQHNGTALDLFAQIHAGRRKRQHARYKAAQPLLGIEGTAELLAALRAHACAPLTPEERGHEGIDYLLQTVKDTLHGDSLEDALFALVRVWRRMYAHHPALDPLEHGVHAECPCVQCTQAAEADRVAKAHSERAAAAKQRQEDLARMARGQR